MAAFAPSALTSSWTSRTCISPKVAPRRPHRGTSAALPPRAQLQGIDLGAGATPGQDDLHDKLLGQLMFCDPDTLPHIVAARAPDLDESFMSYIDAKVGSSNDIEERESLRLFKAAIQDLLSRPPPTLEKDASPDEDEAVPALNAAEMQTYDELIDSLVSARAREDGVKSAVLLQYERIDLRALQRIEARMADCEGDERDALQEVLTAITSEMQVRVDAAANRLREVLSIDGGLDEMKRKIDGFSTSGGLDDAFILLLQKNFETAVENDAQPAIEVLGKLLKYSTEASESRLAPELQLIRRLLRADGPVERKDLLMDAFEQKGKVAMVGGGLSSGVRVDGKKFVGALRGLIEQYGNVDAEFVKKLSTIGEESEKVASKIFGMEDKNVADLQEEAFHKRTVSVWDLEKVEMADEVEGKTAGWEGKLGEIPAGFSEDGKMVV